MFEEFSLAVTILVEETSDVGVKVQIMGIEAFGAGLLELLPFELNAGSAFSEVVAEVGENHCEWGQVSIARL